MLLQGLFVPLTCPFYRDGASYLRKLEHNVARYSLGPAAGLIALAPGGEAAALTDAESYDLLQAAGATAGIGEVLLAGVERASVRAALDLAQHAADAGFDAVVLAPPTDWARLVHADDARELLLFFQAVADASPLPLVLWSDASAPSLQLPVSIVGRLATHERVLGLLDANLDLERTEALFAATAAVRHEVTVTPVFEAVTRRMLQAAAQPPASQGALVSIANLSGGTAVASPTAAAPPSMKTRTKAVGFQILSAGRASDVLPLFEAGVSGFAPPLAACAPQACFEAYAAWKDGDRALADERSQRLAGVEQICEAGGVAAVKYGCDWNGYFGGVPRLPRLPLSAEKVAELTGALASIRN